MSEGCADYWDWLRGYSKAPVACYFNWRAGSIMHTCVHLNLPDGHSPMVHKCACGEERRS